MTARGGAEGHCKIPAGGFTVRKVVTRGVFLLAAIMTGCTSAQVTTAEADLHQAFLVVDVLAQDGSANPDTFKAAVNRVVSLDPTNKTLTSFGAKATAAIDAGDLVTLHMFAAGGAAITAPPSTALVPAKP